MHESLLAEQVLRLSLAEAGALKARSVSRLHLTVGDLEGVSEDALREAFRVHAEGTIAEGAELVIRRTPGRGWTVERLGVVE